MSSHYKFEVHPTTPGETDDEDQAVEQLAARVREPVRDWQEETGIEVFVSEVSRT
ncbi:hypothetical protein [Streptomyces cucumeris]|uniref:hypothetical protein n=1 Tax=Streptomyces cucumeris TaxID=2962890 RepID=UPI0020C83847|nr:hypothetical protein [Streptomyces sp. NEAU-Y11]MCP9209625.1 hypothetical protein [Streptomyces sp. NEAU-Y11]